MAEVLSKFNSPIQFGIKIAKSPQFNSIFYEGMNLVEDVSAYLDGRGREESHSLTRTQAISYASESMRLTTRLMQLAAWLLLQRAINEGEMSQEEAEREKGKTRLTGMGPATPHDILETLPLELQGFIAKTQRLYERVKLLNKMMQTSAYTGAEKNSALVEQLSRLQKSFESR